MSQSQKSFLVQIYHAQRGIVYTLVVSQNYFLGIQYKMKHRQFAITIQNVDQKKTQDKLQALLKNFKEYSYSIEPYNHQEGFHLHLFAQYPNQRYFKAVLKEFEKWKVSILADKPQDEIREWGRVHIEIQKGTLKQCEAYLKGETKNKLLGDVNTGRTMECKRRFRYKSRSCTGPLEEFCDVCSRAECRGCCQGCATCDENHHSYHPDNYEMNKLWNERQRRKWGITTVCV